LARFYVLAFFIFSVFLIFWKKTFIENLPRTSTGNLKLTEIS